MTDLEYINKLENAQTYEDSKKAMWDMINNIPDLKLTEIQRVFIKHKTLLKEIKMEFYIEKLKKNRLLKINTIYQ